MVETLNHTPCCPVQRVLVQGLNLVKRHTPSRSKDEPGGIVTKEVGTLNSNPKP